MKENRKLDRRLQGYSRAAGALRAVRRGLDNRGVRYSAAAAAGAALVGASPADAALIASPNQGQMLSTNSNFVTGGLDVDGDAVRDISISLSAFFFYSPGFSTFTTYFSSYFPGFGSRFGFVDLAGRLQLTGPSVDLSALGLSFSLHQESHSAFPGSFPPSSAPPSLFANSTRTRTFGFSLTAGSNTSGTPNLGWLRAVMQFQPGFTKVSFPTVVFNTTPGGPVHVGDVPGVPEPSSVGLMGLGLLALGARGLREQRRRRKKKQKA